MKEYLEQGIEYLKSKGVDYADIREVQESIESIMVRNEEVETLSRASAHGFGVRVLASGAWGFSCSNLVSTDEMKKVCDEALEIAKASETTIGEKVNLADEPTHVDEYTTAYKEDPFKISLDEKTNILKEATAIMRKNEKIKVAQGSMRFLKINKIFMNTDGSRIKQNILESGCGIECTAMGESETQKRSYPCSHGGDHQAKGYEFIRGLDIIGNADRIRDEALMLIAAPDCPKDKHDIIIGSSQMVLQIHESCGHPIELDRVFGDEISLAGGSFLQPDKLNKLHYGSKIVNIFADATIPGSIGSFGYDDEGVKAQRSQIVKDGLFVGYLMSRQSAHKLGQILGKKIRSNGAMRADGWNRIPLIRMININLEPREGKLEDIIADTKDGIYLDTNKSWSIDDQRINFQFGVEWAREVKNGKLGQVYKNAVYTGITPEFWNSCDAIGGRESWYVWGLPNCGKGDPMQTAHVAHGVPPARFRQVQLL